MSILFELYPSAAGGQAREPLVASFTRALGKSAKWRSEGARGFVVKTEMDLSGCPFNAAVQIETREYRRRCVQSSTYIIGRVKFDGCREKIHLKLDSTT